jgi:hypothetical protein
LSGGARRTFFFQLQIGNSTIKNMSETKFKRPATTASTGSHFNLAGASD